MKNKLKCLIESVKEGRNNSISVTKSRPQPDYAIGFRKEASPKDQFDKLQPLVGDLWTKSYFTATFCMDFPFLTCEVES